MRRYKIIVSKLYVDKNEAKYFKNLGFIPTFQLYIQLWNSKFSSMQ